MNNCLAIVAARGGSKRIPRKNIKNFLGNPIVKYPIDAALHSPCFDEVMVSTDDAEIADVALSFGAKVPFLRSPETSDDHAITADVVFEVLTEYKKLGREFKYCCCIYATAVFVTSKRLMACYEQLTTSNADGLIPIVRYGFPILRSFKIDNGLVKMNWPEHMHTRSQDLPPAFHDCGQFYFLRTDAFLKSRKMFLDVSIPHEIPESEIQDIDNEEDWKIAELKYKLLLERRTAK